MPLTRDFKETIRDRAQRDPKFRKELLRRPGGHAVRRRRRRQKRSCAATSMRQSASPASPTPRAFRPKASCACSARPAIRAPTTSLKS